MRVRVCVCSHTLNLKRRDMIFFVLLGAFAKLRKTTIMSGPPTVRPYETPRLQLVGSHEILYLRVFAKICRENSISIEI